MKNKCINKSLGMHFHRKTLPQKPTKQATMHTGRRAQTTRRDGSYAVKALCCDVWVVCACIAACIVACFIGFGEVFFGRSVSLHDLFLHFLAKYFFCNLFWGVFFLGGGNKFNV